MGGVTGGVRRAGERPLNSRHVSEVKGGREKDAAGDGGEYLSSASDVYSKLLPDLQKIKCIIKTQQKVLLACAFIASWLKVISSRGFHFIPRTKRGEYKELSVNCCNKVYVCMGEWRFGST